VKTLVPTNELSGNLNDEGGLKIKKKPLKTSKKRGIK